MYTKFIGHNLKPSAAMSAIVGIWRIILFEICRSPYQFSHIFSNGLLVVEVSINFFQPSYSIKNPLNKTYIYFDYILPCIILRTYKYVIGPFCCCLLQEHQKHDFWAVSIEILLALKFVSICQMFQKLT